VCVCACVCVCVRACVCVCVRVCVGLGWVVRVVVQGLGRGSIGYGRLGGGMALSIVWCGLVYGRKQSRH